MAGLSVDEPISIQLSAQQWDAVMRLLAKQPFELVAQMIADIQQQCQMHQMRQRAERPRPHLMPEDYGPMADTA